MAVASLILGILSIILGPFGYGFQWVGIIFAIIGIILGAKNTDPTKEGLAKAGKICSIIGLILCVLVFVACVACIGTLGLASLSL